MPYTPPSRSAASTSPPGSPNTERRHTEPTLKVTLPRSSSYLTRHRRTPSVLGPVRQPDDTTNNDLTPPGMSKGLKPMTFSDIIRQSPPPVTGAGGMPSGAVISPPDSLSGSDDEGLEMRGRVLPNLKELQDAVSNLSMRRDSSPTSEMPATGAVGFVEGMHHSFSTGALDALGSRRDSLPDHSGEPNAMVGGSPSTSSEEDSDVEKRTKPPMVRKKSGELVRPALRGSSRPRPASMPGTPTFSKAVHFDAHLEHVRHFLQVDRPLAVSARSSPVENLDSDAEYPFPSSEDETPRSQSPQYDWELEAPILEDVARKSLPARVERFWLSKDCKALQGSVVVANLAFHKNVTCRFTLDNWKTTSEVAAEYTGQIHGTNYDRWTFAIQLSDMAHLETKTMYLCVRYNVNGQEYWDNNRGANFRVNFRRKALIQNRNRGSWGLGARPAGELPRSTRRSNADSGPRPQTIPGFFVGGDPFLERRRSLEKAREFGDESGPIRLKRHTPNSRSEDFTSSTASQNHVFAKRYDFEASLHEAKQSAKTKDSKKDADASVNKPAKSKPGVTSASGNDSPSRKNYTYDEIVNRFCFVRGPS